MRGRYAAGTGVPLRDQMIRSELHNGARPSASACESISAFLASRDPKWLKLTGSGWAFLLLDGEDEMAVPERLPQELVRSPAKRTKRTDKSQACLSGEAASLPGILFSVSETS